MNVVSPFSGQWCVKIHVDLHKTFFSYWWGNSLVRATSLNWNLQTNSVDNNVTRLSNDATLYSQTESARNHWSTWAITCSRFLEIVYDEASFHHFVAKKNSDIEKSNSIRSGNCEKRNDKTAGDSCLFNEVLFMFLWRFFGNSSRCWQWESLKVFQGSLQGEGVGLATTDEIWLILCQIGNNIMRRPRHETLKTLLCFRH